MDSFQIFGKWDADAKRWIVDIDPERDQSGFLTAPNLVDALFRATGTLLENRKFRREQCGEKLIGEDGFSVGL